MRLADGSDGFPVARDNAGSPKYCCCCELKGNSTNFVTIEVCLQVLGRTLAYEKQKV